MWSAQYFNALQVKHRHAVQKGCANIGLIHIHTDGAGLGRRVIDHRYAANGKQWLYVAERRTHLHIGNLGRDIGGVLPAQCLDVAAANGGNSHRHVLHALGAFLCSDHDFFELRTGMLGAYCQKCGGDSGLGE